MDTPLEPIVASASDLPVAVAASLADPAPGERFTIEAAGIPFSTIAWGDPEARPLALIHGVTASAAVWWRVGPALAATGRRVLAPDLPGHGQTGHWSCRPGFREMAVDMAEWVRAAGLDRAGLQVVGHSYGAMIAAHMPLVGLRPETLVLLDPPVLPLDFIARIVDDPGERTYPELRQALVAVAAAEPDWTDGDIRAKAEALTELDEAAARSIVLDNGDWDGGLAALEQAAGLFDIPAQRIDVWLVKGEQASGNYVPDAAIPAFIARLGADHVLTIRDGAHSPQRMKVEATLVALVRALG